VSSAIHASICEAVNALRLPGLAVAITQNQDDLFASGVGSFDTAGLRSIDADTIFGVASLTKLVTAMLIMKLVEQNKLSLDDSLVSHYPQLKIPGQSPIQLKHLLSHTAGFPGLPGRFHAQNIDDPNDSSGGVDGPNSTFSGTKARDASQLVDLINEWDIDLLAPPGEQINYSNEGFCLLGGIIEQLTQQSYASLAHNWVFEPLDMTHSYIGGANLTRSDNVAFPLLRDSSEFRTGDFWQTPLFYPAGGCVSSVRDIVRLISVLSADSDLLTPTSRDQMMTTQAMVASRPGGRSGYGLGLEVQTIDSETTLVWHSGQRAGVSSFMGWLVEEKVAISVLCNVGGAPVTGIAHELIGSLLGRSNIAWPPMAPDSRLISSGLSLNGCYETDEGNRIVVERVGNDWIMIQQSESIQMTFLSDDSGVVGDQTFRFLGADSGAPSALALDLRVLPRVS
jgi:CubicO group peptidase (beta-lactamase class C family)